MTFRRHWVCIFVYADNLTIIMNTVTFSRQTVSVFVHVVCKMTTRNSVCSLQVADERGESVAQYTNQSSNLSGSCASFHHRANLSRSCIVFHQLVKLSCLYTLFFSPTCEFTRLMHCFSPSGIKLMHFYHQLLNLSGLCTSFFTTV